MPDESMPYRFHVHATHKAWRLVTHASRGWPPGAQADQWIFARARCEADINSDVRDAIANAGYCLFRIGCTFAELEAEMSAPN